MARQTKAAMAMPSNAGSADSKQIVPRTSAVQDCWLSAFDTCPVASPEKGARRRMSQWKNPLHDRVIFKPALKALLGDTNDMRVHRLANDPDSGFPAPQFLGRRPWWWEGEVRHWLENLPRRPRQPPAFAAANGEQQAEAPAPQAPRPKRPQEGRAATPAEKARRRARARAAS
jgi:hypothetical protein